MNYKEKFLEHMKWLREEAGVDVLSFEYGGHGDEGYVESIEVDCMLDDDADFYWLDDTHQMYADIEEHLYETLPGGFGNGAGSRGDGRIFTEDGRIEVNHGQNYITTKWSKLSL